MSYCCWCLTTDQYLIQPNIKNPNYIFKVVALINVRIRNINMHVNVVSVSTLGTIFSCLNTQLGALVSIYRVLVFIVEQERVTQYDSVAGIRL